MHRLHRSTSRALLLGIALALPACAGPSGSGTREPSPSADAGARPAATDTERLEAIYRARADSALMDVHPADVRFMTGMIGHHAQALVMASLAGPNEASPSIRTLAARITNGQRDEIALMQRWLRERDRPVPEVDASGRVEGAADHAMHMAGMLTPDQLDALAAARGPDFDRRFLTYMIQHHEGAVTMVHDLFATDGAAQEDAVFKIASDIQVDQRSEIARMKRMLDALPSG